MSTILPVPILQDNYVWLMHQAGHALVVDPGVAAPVVAQLETLGLHLSAILVTHHHGDHTGGLAELVARYGCPVYGPPSIAGVSQGVGEGGKVSVPAMGVSFAVLAVPGHTLDHIAYHGDGVVFCGDTLFACGCGRLFEGTATQMQASLARLAALPDETLVCCTHEYTLSNQRFALAVEPNNPALQQRHEADRLRREQQLPTLPSNIGLERATNPFLRWAEPAIQAAAASQGAIDNGPVAVFATLREWKNVFRG
ncbi:hydroxyacylglutathione hydrolase [Chitinimonas viridis]|uniref:Hydroxyacylglutathione hydrolase n=1 Tax=Chitinimonas viridis TaxID=664880 RepID=A0ABT8B655_9NEIS|nr:hydroxyacylglutathione hydrolase [Chitinimonas viridis]MDN3577748.1 hydroxyacylglutathione hydrolase [Chitinimonas viridis]